MREVPIANQDQAVAYIERSASIILPDVVGIHDHARGIATGIGVRVAESVKAAECKLGAGAQIEVGYHLVLVENSARLIVVNVPRAISQRTRAQFRVAEGKGPRERCVDVIGEELVDPM